MGARRTRCQRAAHSYLLAGGRARRRVNVGVVTGCGGCSAGQCVPQCVTLAPWGLRQGPEGALAVSKFLPHFFCHSSLLIPMLARPASPASSIAFSNSLLFSVRTRSVAYGGDATHPPSVLPPPRRETRGVGLGATVESRVARLLQALPPSGRLFPWLERAARAAALNPPAHTAVAVAA